MKSNEEKLDFARKMRIKQTPSESRFYIALLKAFDGLVTIPACQIVVGPFIADFKVKNLLIEIDGSSHCKKEQYDRRRSKYLENKGFRVLRFSNAEILRDPEGLAIKVRQMTEPHEKKNASRIWKCPPRSALKAEKKFWPC